MEKIDVDFKRLKHQAITFWCQQICNKIFSVIQICYEARITYHT